jgi:two-component system chemotaxis response regulator CheY
MARILVVDDSSLARRSTRRILEEAGHTVSEAQDGLAAIELYYHERPDITLLDVTMREMDGIEVLHRLREINAVAKVIIVTADIQSSTHELALGGGASGFVVKPVVGKVLLDAVEVAIKGGV